MLLKTDVSLRLQPEPKVKPVCNAFEAGLFDPSLIRLAHIATQRKAMLHAREELEMIGLSMIYAKFDSFVARCSGECVINFRTRHEQRPFELLEVPVFQKRWVRKGSYRTSRLAYRRLGKSVTDIRSAKAIPTGRQKSPGKGECDRHTRHKRTSYFDHQKSPSRNESILALSCPRS